MSTQNTASWCLFHVSWKYCAWRGALKSIFQESSWFCHRIHTQKEYCLFVAQSLSSQYESWIDDWTHIDRTSDMTNAFEETFRHHDMVLQWRINKIASWMIVENSEVQNCPEESVEHWNLFTKGFLWSSSTKSCWNGRIAEIPQFYLG